MSKQFDLIVFGATGFTGRLVAEYLSTHYGAVSDIRWAMAGRSMAKLEEVRALINAPESVALIAADATDSVALAALVARTKVVITTVGPYQLHGEALAVPKVRGSRNMQVTREYAIGVGGLLLVDESGSDTQAVPQLPFSSYYGLLSRSPSRQSPAVEEAVASGAPLPDSAQLPTEKAQ